MKNINSRFEIIEDFVEVEKGVKKGSCFDLQKARKSDALLFEFGTESFSVAGLVEDNFQRTIGHDADFLVRGLGFFVVQTIDGKYIDKTQYLYLTEQRDLLPLEDYIRENENINILEISIEILQIINYFEQLGIIWRFFSKNNFYYDLEKDIVVLEDPIRASVQILEESKGLNTTDFERDLSSLGEILLSFMLGKDLSDDPRNELNNYKQLMRTSKGLDEKDGYILIFFIEKLINDEYVKKRFIFGDIIDEINKNFLSNYPLTAVDNNQNLNLSIFYEAREDSNEKLKQGLRSVNFGLERKKVIFLRGERESGKSTLANQAYRKSNFVGVKTYMAKVSSSKKYNSNFLSVLKNYSDDPSSVKDFGGREKLIGCFAELLDRDMDRLIDPWNLTREDARLVTVVVELVLENLRNDFTIFIIDGFDKLGPTVQYILMLTLSYNSRKMAYILVQDDYSIKANDNLARIREAFSEMGVLSEIRLDNFTRSETESFLKKLLVRNYIPEEFSALLYEKSYGNLKNLRELVRLMLDSQLLSYDPYKERVNISKDLKPIEDFEAEQVRDYSKEKIISGLHEDEMDLLKLLSVLKTGHNENTLSRFKEYKGDLSNKFEKLEGLGLLDSMIIDGEKYYRIGDQALRNDLYNSLDEERRLAIHRDVVENTKVESKELKIALVDHLEHVNTNESRKKAFAYAREIAESYEDEGNYREAAVFYEKLLDFSRGHEYEFQVLLKLFTLRDALSEKYRLNKLTEELEKLSKSEVDVALVAEFYTLACKSLLISSKEQDYYAEALYDLYLKHPHDEVELYYYMTKSLEDYRCLNFDDTIIAANTGLNLLEQNDRADMKSYFYMMKAKAMRGMGKIQEATKLLYEAFKYTKLIRDIRSEIGINNEIAEIMYEYEGREDRAYEIYTNNLKLSKEYGFRVLELASLINLSKVSKKTGNANQAYSFAEEAYIKSEEIGVEERATLSLLIEISVSIGEFAKGYKYFLESKNIEKIQDSAEHISYIISVSELFFPAKEF